MLRVSLALAPAFVILAVAVLLAGESRSRADLTYVNPAGIHTLDPARMSWTQDLRLGLNLWEGLTTYDPRTLEPIEGAAAFPPKLEDELTYSFTIRSDSTWSDGSPVTSLDFIRGWRRAMEPGSAGDYQFLLTRYIEGAADYVAWRLRTIRVLTGLQGLARHGSISASEASDLCADEEFRSLIGVDCGTQAGTDDGMALARRLSKVEFDWSEAHARVHAHVASILNERFAEVGMSARQPDTLVVKLAEPCPFFLDLCAFPTFSPVHESVDLLRERHNDLPITAEGLVVYDPQWTKPSPRANGYRGLITNGPYRLKEWQFKRFARLEVNPHFRSAHTMACRSVDMMVYPDVNMSLMAYEAGHVDLLTDLSVDYEYELARLAQSGERTDIKLCHALATYYFVFNCKDEHVGGRINPFVDADVRRAFSLAVDRRAIVEEVLNRGDRIARSLTPPDTIAGYVPPSGLQQDILAAKTLLDNSSVWQRAGAGSIELLYTPADERVCQAIARMWRTALGVNVALRCQESKTFSDARASRQYMVARANWYADYNDPTTFLDVLKSDSTNNDAGYSSKPYDELLARAARTMDRRERYEILQRAEAIIIEQDCPVLPILHYAQMMAFKPHVQGLYANPRLVLPFKHVRFGP